MSICAVWSRRLLSDYYQPINTISQILSRRGNIFALRTPINSSLEMERSSDQGWFSPIKILEPACKCFYRRCVCDCPLMTWKHKFHGPLSRRLYDRQKGIIIHCLRTSKLEQGRGWTYPAVKHSTPGKILHFPRSRNVSHFGLVRFPDKGNFGTRPRR